MSFLKKLFGSGGTNGTTPKALAEFSYEGYQILTMPMKEGDQFRVCALIRKEFDGEFKEHRLIRADICSTADEASDIATRKAQQMIDEQGDRIFG
ncbi:MAG: HlyU family transcriptional regulator [Rhizobiaceae bacterium]